MSTQRTIKFRAWHSGEAFMIDWDFIIDDGILPYFSSDSYALMQYTGLKDKDDPPNEIYEGDVVSLHGTIEGNRYENEALLKDPSNLLIEGLGTRAWRSTEQAAMERGCMYSE